MSDEAVIAAMLNVVNRLNEAGDSWGAWAEEIPLIALRRWRTYKKRHPKSKRVLDWQRVSDLVKGLRANFEPSVPYTSDSDWRCLAEALLPVLRENDSF